MPECEARFYLTAEGDSQPPHEVVGRAKNSYNTLSSWAAHQTWCLREQPPGAFLYIPRKEAGRAPELGVGKELQR